MLWELLLALGFFLAALEHAEVLLEVMTIAALCKAKIPLYVLDRI